MPNISFVLFSLFTFVFGALVLVTGYQAVFTRNRQLAAHVLHEYEHNPVYFRQSGRRMMWITIAGVCLCVLGGWHELLAIWAMMLMVTVLINVVFCQQLIRRLRRLLDTPVTKTE